LVARPVARATAHGWPFGRPRRLMAGLVAGGGRHFFTFLLFLIIMQQPPPADDSDNVRFQAVLDRLGPHNDHRKWNPRVGLSHVNLTNRMAQRLGRALLDTNQTVTGLSLSLRSMTPAAHEYHLLLQFLATTSHSEPTWDLDLCPGRLTPHQPVDVAAEEAADVRMARTVGILLSALHRNPVEKVYVVLTNFSLTPSMVRLATGFWGVHFDNCTFNKNHGSSSSNDDDEETEARTLLVTNDDSAPYHRVELTWRPGQPDNGALSDIIVGLTQYSFRRLNCLDCDLHNLTNQLARQFLDLAGSKKRGKGMELILRFKGSLTWEPESMEMLTQNHTAIDELYVFSEDDKNADMTATQSAVLECLRHSTILDFDYRRTLQDYRIALDETGQRSLANILTRNRLLPQLLTGTSLRTDEEELRPHAIRLALELQSPHLIKLVFDLVRAKVPVLDEPSFQSLLVETKKK
jgi:hypothetical protein